MTTGLRNFRLDDETWDSFLEYARERKTSASALLTGFVLRTLGRSPDVAELIDVKRLSDSQLEALGEEIATEQQEREQRKYAELLLTAAGGDTKRAIAMLQRQSAEFSFIR